MRRFARMFAAALLLGAALSLGELPAYTLLGFTLPPTARDVRVHENFASPTASDNLALHPNFPGAFGASMAVWKAAVEWGSRAHGDGSGDPTQASLGGHPSNPNNAVANFDFVWQGASFVQGVVGLNTALACSTSLGPGVLCQTVFTPPGWQILFDETSVVWDDGPGPPAPGAADIQGIAAHQLGHALGLGHSSVGGATMFSGTSMAGSVSLRSIEADDAAGVQAAYGFAAASKPRITGVTGNAIPGGTIQISGETFHPTSNHVWFRAFQSTGAPAVAGPLPSSLGGTRISAVVPFDAGSGDVLVFSPSVLFGALSNAWPLAIAGATFEWRGGGCPGTGAWVPVVGSQGGRPSPCNAGFVVTLRSAVAVTPVVLALGLSDSSWLGIPLPIPLDPFGAPGCALRVSPDFLLPALTSGAGAVDLPLAVPCNASPGTLHFQWIVLDPGANPLGLAFSNAARGIVQ